MSVAFLCPMRIELTSTFVTCIVETTALCCLCDVHVNTVLFGVGILIFLHV